MSEQSEKLMKARCRLMTREPWYGHVAMGMVWIPCQMTDQPEQRRTMGVRIVNGGEVQCLYYPKFVDSLNIKELFTIIQHEIEHIVRVHCIRVGDRNPMAWNIAADMTVNGLKSAPRIGYAETGTNELVIPFKDQLVWIPSNWEKDESSEFYYNKLMKDAPKVCSWCGQAVGKSSKAKGDDDNKGKGGKNHDDDGQGDGSGDPGQNNNTCKSCGQECSNDYSFGNVYGRALDNHSIWNQSDVSHDEARQIVKDIVDQATEKCQGHHPGHLTTAIQELNKPVIHWRELLRHYMGRHVGNHRVTYSRRNRRRDWFGVPGISHRATASMNVIVDTSGSIGPRELEQFFSEIEAISSRCKTMVLQWDSAFQGYDRYRRGDWRRFSVKGRGGTDMAAPVQWLIDNKLVSDVQVMLTDGYCNYADPNKVKFPMITVITTPESSTKDPLYGHVVRMKL